MHPPITAIAQKLNALQMPLVHHLPMRGDAQGLLLAQLPNLRQTKLSATIALQWELRRLKGISLKRQENVLTMKRCWPVKTQIFTTNLWTSRKHERGPIGRNGKQRCRKN